jgi:hypothetical protein
MLSPQAKNLGAVEPIGDAAEILRATCSSSA